MSERADEGAVRHDVSERIGRCHHCSESLWPEDNFVQVGSLRWHRGCAELLVTELGRVL